MKDQRGSISVRKFQKNQPWPLLNELSDFMVRVVMYSLFLSPHSTPTGHWPNCGPETPVPYGPCRGISFEGGVPGCS